MQVVVRLHKRPDQVAILQESSFEMFRIHQQANKCHLASRG